MTKETKLPEPVRPFNFHGMDLEQISDGQWIAECPECNRKKWYCGTQGLWDCKVCGTKGNATEFIRRLHNVSERNTSDAAYEELCADRKLLEPSTLKEWRAAKSVLTGDWLMPGYNEKGALTQLYRYVFIDGKRRLLATPTFNHKLFGVELYDKDKSDLFICEGPWDAMALWEVMSQTKWGDDGLKPTSNRERSMLAEASVLAVPGCNVFSESWLPLAAHKRVVILFDNDHPPPSKGGAKVATPAAFMGVQRLVRMLRSANDKPEEVAFLRWGDKGYNEALPNGYDVRDALLASTERTEGRVGLVARQRGLTGLMDRVVEPPEEWQGSPKKGKSGGELECEVCESYKSLMASWKKALRWTPGLDHALTVMLASIASTKTVGDQLWIKVIGPAACGKSTLCEAVSVASKYVMAKSTIRGFHSGYRDTASEGEDCSLVAQVRDKTLVTKDGDTLLQSPNLQQILAEARDLYDSTSRTHYRNAMSRDYSGIRMTWILCGTSSLRLIDSSELGERFLDCVIMEGIDDDVEDDILDRVVDRADANMSLKTDDDASSQQSPELTAAMRLTGGYVHWLRENAPDILSQIKYPTWAKERIKWLAKFVAHMRARPSTRQEETAEREFASRLASQLIRLGKCLALVMNRPTVDARVVDRVRQVALDTSRGRTMNIVSFLYDHKEGSDLRGVATAVNCTDDQAKKLLRFLRMIGVVDYVQRSKNGIVRKATWVLTERMRKMYFEVKLKPFQPPTAQDGEE